MTSRPGRIVGLVQPRERHQETGVPEALRIAICPRPLTAMVGRAPARTFLIEFPVEAPRVRPCQTLRFRPFGFGGERIQSWRSDLARSRVTCCQLVVENFLLRKDLIRD